MRICHRVYAATLTERKTCLSQKLNCARAWFNLTSMKTTVGGAHLKIRDTTTPTFGAVASTL